jgi:hypothetical protein
MIIELEKIKRALDWRYATKAFDPFFLWTPAMEIFNC